VNDELYKVYNLTAASIAKDKLVYVCGWMETGQPGQSPKICLADANVSGAKAKFITTQAIANATFCINCLAKQTTLLSQNTLGLTVGDAMYLSETAGANTSTAPTAANSIQQIVGRVRAVSATVGVIEIDIEANDDLVKIGANEMQAGAIGPDSIGLSVRAATNLAAGDLVRLDSYNATDGIYTANIADADVANGQAVYVATGTILSGATGTVYKKASVAMNVGAAAAGDPIYLTVTGTTTNTKSTSAPTGSDDLVQIVGRVQVTGAAGPVLIDLLDFVPSVATNQMQDDSVTNDKLAAFAGQGYIKVGGAAGAPTDYDANNDGFILIGDGTDILSTDFNNSGFIGVGDGTNYASVDVTGDVDLATNGAVTVQAMAIEPTMEGFVCVNASGGDYAAADLVYFSSHNATLPLCALADADVANGSAQYVVTAACVNGATCTVARSFLVTGVNTAAVGAVGDPIYLSITGTTTNTWSTAAPTGVDDIIQIVARVTIDDAAGAFLVDLRSLGNGTIARNEIQADAINGAKIADDSIDSEHYVDGSVDNQHIANNTIKQTKWSVRGRQFNFRDTPLHMLTDGSAVTSGGAGTTSGMMFPEGRLELYFEEAAAAIPAFTTSATGIDFGLDDNADDGMQLRPPQFASGPGQFIGQTDAFYVKATFTIEDASGIDPGCLGIMTPQAFADFDALAGLDGYGGAGEEVVAICIGSGAGVDPAVVHTYTKVNNAASVDTTLATHTWADGATHTFEIDVAASGAVTYKFDGVAVTGAAALTVTADSFYPFILHDSSAEVNATFTINLFEYDLQ